MHLPHGLRHNAIGRSDKQQRGDDDLRQALAIVELLEGASAGNVARQPA